MQLWTVARVDQDLTERWAGQLLARFRFDDDVSRPKDFMLRTLSHWELGAFDGGVGYDYVYSFVNSSTIEHRPFQLAEHRWQPEFLRGISIKNRVRLDERFRADADGVIARLRYRLRFGRRIGSRWYVVMSDELFANLNDRGSGPPHMFELNRLRLATGREIVPGLRVELGYEWQLSAGRDRANIDRHVFLVSLFAAPATYRAGRGD